MRARRGDSPLDLLLVLAVTLTALPLTGCSVPRGGNDRSADVRPENGGGGVEARTTVSAGALDVTVDRVGRVVGLVDRNTGRDHRAQAVDSPLLSIRMDDALHAPRSLDWDPVAGIARLDYPGDVTASVRITEKPTHVVLELLAVDPIEPVELVVWGPYATTISDTIGETVGVVRNSTFAMGIQALNPKTLGGRPWRDNDTMPQVDLFESGDFSNLSEEGKRHVLYRVEAAKPEDFGSTLQAYCRDRSRERVIGNWGHERYVAPRFEDGGVAGTKIALFGAPTNELLETLGAIELEEHLPHPMVDGQWGKTARSAAAAYLILDFGEDDIDKALAWTRRAGLRYLYHPGPFRTWGHFELNDRFPGGTAGLRRCVRRAEAAGVHLGVHTLSNFVTTNDAYVTPVPDPRLARVGSSTLTGGVDAVQAEIPVAAPTPFAGDQNNTLRTVVIGEELVQYRDVSRSRPPRLLDCKRGAFGTRAASHAEGDDVTLLADHGYKVFLANADLGREMATTIAKLFNETGLRQISFDGLEGNQSTGMGNYGEVLFTTTWYDNLTEDLQRHLIVDASRTSHFFWHVYTRMNWGEPWYAGFRESQTEYRLKNQPYFRRNLMPAMLGWFRMTSETTTEDVEWMLARSAAFDAGYAFVTSYDALDGNGFTDRILEAIARWERARMADAFSATQKRRMEDVNREFQLAEDGSDGWQLVEVHPRIFRHKCGERQPGEPVTSMFSFGNPGEEQSLDWTLTAEAGDVGKTRITIDETEIVIPIRLREGWSTRYRGGSTADVRDRDHRFVKKVAIDAATLRIASGRHTVEVGCRAGRKGEATARLEVRPHGAPEAVGR